ncbi:MAG: hypothetical protein KDB27_32185 [Planctomycetales bacterium]|nr:hypothetical protein [Planctomycetales bacterium]
MNASRSVAAALRVTSGSRGVFLLCLVAGLWIGGVGTPSYCLAQLDYERPVTAAPQPEDIGGEYQLPQVQRPLPRSVWLYALDVAVLAAGMGIVAWVSRRGRRQFVITAITLGSIAYFGFYRQGCVCPVGSTQNVAA